MQFMYVLQLNPHYQSLQNWNDDTNAILNEHWNYLVNLHEQKVMKLVGKTEYEIDNPANKGIAIFEAETREKAEQIMQQDPCVAKGVMSAELHPFKIALL